MKKFNQKFGYLGWLLLVSLVAMGAKIGDDILRVGTKTGTDIEIQMGEGRVKWDSGANKMQFSNNSGTLFKDIGSGAGGAGGQNFFENGDAESGLLNWNNIGGGAFATNAITPINGLNDFAWDASAQNDVVRTDLIVIPEKFKGQACQIEFTYSGGTDDLVKPQVVDSSNVKLPSGTFANQVDGTDFLKAQTGIVTRSIYFICPAAGDIKFEFNQTAVGNPAAMNYDDVHVGENLGLSVTVAKAADSFVDLTNATGFASTNTMITFFGTSATQGSDLTYNASATLGDNITVNVDGTYDVLCVIERTTESNAGVSVNSANLTTGVSSIPQSELKGGFANASTARPAHHSHQAFYSAGDILRCHGSGVTASNLGRWRFMVSKVADTNDQIKIFESVPKVAENINEFSAVINSGGTIQSQSSQFITSVTPGATGIYNIVMDAGVFSVIPACQITANLQSGADIEVGTCDVVTTTTLTVKIEDVAAGAAVNQEFAITLSKQGADFKLPVVQPILVNQVESSKSSGVRVEGCRVNNNGTATIDTASTLCESWVQSVSRTALGVVDITVIPNTFSAPPVCSGSCLGSDKNEDVHTATTVSNVVFRCEDTATGGDADNDIYIQCTGAR